jgi:hypothetical protein
LNKNILYLEPLKESCIELLKGLAPSREKLGGILNTFFYKEIKYLEDLIFDSAADKSQPLPGRTGN